MDLINLHGLLHRLNKCMTCNKAMWAILCFSLSPLSSAVELSGTLNTGLDYTNNVRTASLNKEEEFIQRAGLSFGLLEERKNIKADANLSLDHSHYYNNTFDDETSLRSGFGLFSVDLIEEFFNWQATFTRTDVLTSSSEDENPDTREYRNIVRTGPTISYAISRTLDMQMSANYIYLDNSGDTAVDSERANANVQLRYTLNSLTSFSGGASREEILDSDDGEDIINTSWNVGFVRQLTDGSLDARMGIQTVSSSEAISDNSDETDSAFFDISFTRERVFGQNLTISYMEAVTDTAIGFGADEPVGNSVPDRNAGPETDSDTENERVRFGPDGAPITNDNGRINAVSQTDFEKRKRTTFSIGREFNDFSYDLNLIYQDSAFERANTSERYRSVTLGFQPKLYSRLVPRVEHRYVRQDFQDKSQGEDVSRSYQFSMSYETVPKVFLNGFLRFEKTDNDELSIRESEEFVLGAGVSWNFL